MKIKLRVSLAHHSEWEFEYHQSLDNFRIIIIKSKEEVSFNVDDGKIWSAAITKEDFQTISELIEHIYLAPHQNTRITILDGSIVHGSLEKDGEVVHFKFRETEEGSNELELMRKTIELGSILFKNEGFLDFTDLLYSYFPQKFSEF